MAKKKKEVCPYCGKAFAYLSRHKCRIKERVEGIDDDKTSTERRIERIEEKRKDINRNLKKDERIIFELIKKEKDLFFEDLQRLTKKSRTGLDNILNLLQLQSKIKVHRELIDAAWTKHIFMIEDYDDEVDVSQKEIDRNNKDFIWNIFSRQPCFVCPFSDKCNETNVDQFNPFYCPWLTEWITYSIEGQAYDIDFDTIKAQVDEA